MDCKTMATLLITAYFVGSSCAVEAPCIFLMTARGYTCRPDVNLADHDYWLVGGEHLTVGQTDDTVVSFVSINNNFRHVPSLFRFRYLRHIHVSGSMFTTVAWWSGLANRTTLEVLNLSNNQIVTIEAGSFANTPRLSEINLRSNRIRNLAPAIFDNIHLLRTVDLSYNSIERLSSGSLFHSNPQLTKLLLSGNRVDFINETIFSNVPDLTSFDFTANLCYSAFFADFNLTLMRQQMLQRLTPCFGDVPVNVRCTFDWLEMQNGFFGYGCSLRDIELYDEKRPVAVGGFHSWPMTNAHVKQLRIHLSHTPFIIPELFTAFVNLEGLEIGFSQLQRFQPGAFVNATNLRYLHIRNNDLHRLETNSLQHLVNLEQLYVWWNQIYFISESAFNGLERLHELHLMSTSISSIPPQTFRPLVALRLLELKGNQLELIDSRWFVENLQLRQLMMNRNLINAIHPSLLDLPQLAVLFLESNLCVSEIFLISEETRGNVTRALQPCFDNYVANKRRFILEVDGEVTILYKNGTEVVRLME